MFLVLVPLPFLSSSEPTPVWALAMEPGHHTSWDYDQRDIAIHPERWDHYGRMDPAMRPSWCPGPYIEPMT